MQEHSYEFNSVTRDYIVELVFHSGEMDIDEFVDYFKCFSWSEVMEEAKGSESKAEETQSQSKGSSSSIQNKENAPTSTT